MYVGTVQWNNNNNNTHASPDRLEFHCIHWLYCMIGVNLSRALCIPFSLSLASHSNTMLPISFFKLSHITDISNETNLSPLPRRYSGEVFSSLWETELGCRQVCGAPAGPTSGWSWIKKVGALVAMETSDNICIIPPSAVKMIWISQSGILKYSIIVFCYCKCLFFPSAVGKPNGKFEGVRYFRW